MLFGLRRLIASKAKNIQTHFWKNSTDSTKHRNFRTKNWSDRHFLPQGDDSDDSDDGDDGDVLTSE